ncbi:hypothetical protein LTR66_015758 [Elasticomyces elasticus]|nr:hypothetical protein LTR66_015758 [Elasticomyces elasticus]
MPGSIKNNVLGYDRLASPTVSRYISEQDFWVLLQSFFGLGPHPALCLEQTSASKDKIPYIKSYLRSKPTPVDPWNGVDDYREMVKICTRLTERIFQNNHSKTILLRVDSQDLLSAIEENWDLFKGFGMICQYCDDVGPTQLDSDEVELPQAWLQATNRTTTKAKRISSREGQGMLQVWGALQSVLLAARQPDPGRIMMGGLGRIYQALLTADETSRRRERL